MARRRCAEIVTQMAFQWFEFANIATQKPICGLDGVCVPLFPFHALCYTDRIMTSEFDREKWEARFARWGARLRGWQLEGLAAALLDAAEPLSVLGAQMLYVAQPALSVFVPGDEVGQLAQLLEDPDALAWMRQSMLESLDDEGDHPGGQGA